MRLLILLAILHESVTDELVSDTELIAALLLALVPVGTQVRIAGFRGSVVLTQFCAADDHAFAWDLLLHIDWSTADLRGCCNSAFEGMTMLIEPSIVCIHIAIFLLVQPSRCATPSSAAQTRPSPPSSVP